MTGTASLSAFDAFFMEMALREAEYAAESGEVPAGAVVVRPAVLVPAHDGHPAIVDPDPSKADILSRAHNKVEILRDATAHAEMLAISQASERIGAWRLSGTRLYVTKEPCPMCAGAISLSRVDTVVWAQSDPKRGGGSVFGIFSAPGMNHRPATISGILEEKAASTMRRFFEFRRSWKQGDAASKQPD